LLFQLALTFVASVGLAIAIPPPQRDRGDKRMADPAPDPTPGCNPRVGCRASDNNRKEESVMEPMEQNLDRMALKRDGGEKRAEFRSNDAPANCPKAKTNCHFCIEFDSVTRCCKSWQVHQEKLGGRRQRRQRRQMCTQESVMEQNLDRMAQNKMEAVRQAEETAEEKTNAEEVATVFAKRPCYEPATNCMRCMMFDRVNRCCKFWAPILGRRRRHQICTQKKRKQKRSTTEESAVDKTGEKSGNLRSHILASDAVKQEEKMAMDKTEAKSKNLRL